MDESPPNPAPDVLLLGYEEWENLGLRSIAAYLGREGVRVTILTLRTPREELLAAIRRAEPAIVGFSLIFQRLLEDFAGLIAYLREAGVRSHFTMGGHFPSIEPRATLEAIPGLDSIVRGEGEYTLLELLRHVERPAELVGVAGLAYRSANGEIHINAARPKIACLDDLPFPLRGNQLPAVRGLGLCSIAASRGCNYDCSFCSIHRFYAEAPGPRRRTRSPQNVVAEMVQLYHERGIRIFVFEDDDLFMRGSVQRQWVADFVRELQASGIARDILWRVSCRIDDVDPEPIGLMMQAGLMAVYLGIEAGNDEGLKVYNKHYRVQDVYDAIASLRTIGMPFEYGFMILNPYTTFDMLRGDIDFLKAIGEEGDSVVEFTKMVPYAGTPIAGRLAEEGRLGGTLAAPDYNYLDRRLAYFQWFLSAAFHVRNFSEEGLGERLRAAKLDLAVVTKYFSRSYDAEAYGAALRRLIRAANAAALEKTSMAARLMESHTEEQILAGWPYVLHLVQEARAEEAQLDAELDALRAAFGSHPARTPVPATPNP